MFVLCLFELITFPKGVINQNRVNNNRIVHLLKRGEKRKRGKIKKEGFFVVMTDISVAEHRVPQVKECNFLRNYLFHIHSLKGEDIKKKERKHKL